MSSVIWGAGITLGYLLVGWAVSSAVAFFDREADSEKGFYSLLALAWPGIVLVLPVVGLWILLSKAKWMPWEVGPRLAKKRNQLLDARDVLKGKNVPASR